MPLPHPTDDQMLIAFTGTRTTALIAPLKEKGRFRVVAIRDPGDHIVALLAPRLPAEVTEKIRVAIEDPGRFAREAPREDLFWLSAQRLAAPDDVKQMMTRLKVEELFGPQMIIVLHNEVTIPGRHDPFDLFFSTNEESVQLNHPDEPIDIDSVTFP